MHHNFPSMQECEIDTLENWGQLNFKIKKLKYGKIEKKIRRKSFANWEFLSHIPE